MGNKKIYFRWYYVPIFGILILMVFGRIKLYGDLRLSVPTRDTASFVSSSEVPILSWEALTARRLFTTNLLYKVFSPDGGFQEIEPSVDTAWRRVYPGYDRISLFQSLLSIAGWGILALAITSKTRNVYIKNLSATLTLLFGFTPNVADWDSVLGSESLSFSLFALALGLLIWLVFDIYEQNQNKLKTTLLASLCFITFSLWTFTRDANLYAMFVTSSMLIVTIVGNKRFRSSVVLVILAIVSTAVLGLGFVSSMQSTRSRIQVEHVISEYILPYPERTNFMLKMGMPSPESPSFEEWLNKNAPRTYMLFLITHPGFTLSYFFVGTYVAFDPYLQSYFRGSNLPWRTQWIAIGSELHLGVATLIVVLILLSVLWAYSNSDKSKDKDSKPWTWVATWIFLTGIATMFVSIFGDTVALHRHAIISTTHLRLLMWILIIVVSDLLLTKNFEPNNN